MTYRILWVRYLYISYAHTITYRYLNPGKTLFGAKHGWLLSTTEVTQVLGTVGIGRYKSSGSPAVMMDGIARHV